MSGVIVKIDRTHMSIEVACNHLHGLLKETLDIGTADNEIGQFPDIAKQIQVISVLGFYHYTAIKRKRRKTWVISFSQTPNRSLKTSEDLFVQIHIHTLY